MIFAIKLFTLKRKIWENKMGKFDGILLCTDLDGTLLSSKTIVSEENIKAINYFKEQGGKFTFVTGRVPKGAGLIRKWVEPNAPIVVFNGAGVYDFAKEELLWGAYLTEDVKKVVEYVEERTPDFGLVVCTDENVYFPVMNDCVDAYYKLENLPLKTPNWRDIKEKWKKALFVVNSKLMPVVVEAVEQSGYKDNFHFVKSCANYYEIIPKGQNKGTGLEKLCEITGIPKEKTIAVGDNENDIEMIEYAGLGVAVGNATDSVKRISDMITVTNDENAIAKIIWDLDSGKIKI